MNKAEVIHYLKNKKPAKTPKQKGFPQLTGFVVSPVLMQDIIRALEAAETESLPADLEAARPVDSMTHDEANSLWSYLGFNPDYERLYAADGMPEKTTLQFFQDWFFREPKFGGHSERFDFPNTKKLFTWLANHGFDIGANNQLTQNTAKDKEKDELIAEAADVMKVIENNYPATTNLWLNKYNSLTSPNTITESKE